ncbi:MAG: pyridoxamine 5'-phosphate oxidase [Bacteroidetes bacterium]|nr:pyridoxamine 5'-phosphate oxidase [Bacteroidota bacterium]
MTNKRNDLSLLKNQQSVQKEVKGEWPKDPMILFGKWYEEARKNEEHEPEAMALATADDEGRPSLRMVLFRDISKTGLCFFTNYDSRKAIQLKLNPYSSLLVYWPKLYRQVRVEGKVRKAPAVVSDDYFNSRPLGSRISACISPQSAVIPDRLFLEAMHEAFSKDLGGKPPKRPANWGGYIFVPDRFEFWMGRENRLHDRIQYRKKRNNWIIERLAP